MSRDADTRFLRRALELAARGRTSASPNPCVGAVIVQGGKVVGEGWHRRAGEPHAEVEALRAARSDQPLQGEQLRGATLFVNLEPCSHHGRTPPCADALIEAGISRVVGCLQDPNPAVAGRGYDRLRQAGIEVEVGLLAREAVALNLPFLTSNLHQRPAVTLKWAMSLDGRIATVSGESQWISSPEGRAWALDLRREHDAILVGSGTVLADDPRLNRRGGPSGSVAGSDAGAGVEASRPPILRAVLDRRLRTPPTARLFDVEGPLLIYTEVPADCRTFQELVSAGETAAAQLHLICLPRVTPPAVLADLHARNVDGQERAQAGGDPVRSLLVEGGGEVAAAFVAADLFDRVEVCCAPRLLSGRSAPGPLGGAGIGLLASAPQLDALSATACGVDVILSSHRQGCLEALTSSCLPASS